MRTHRCARWSNHLEGEGYEVIAVASNGEAREVLKMFTPALVIAEIEGEDMPGYDLCAHIKSTENLAHPRDVDDGLSLSQRLLERAFAWSRGLHREAVSPGAFRPRGPTARSAASRKGAGRASARRGPYAPPHKATGRHFSQ